MKRTNLEGKSRSLVGKILNRLRQTGGISIPMMTPMQDILLGFYVGSGTTLAFAIGFGIWWQARVQGLLEASYEEGVEDALTQVASAGSEPPRAQLQFVVDPN